MSATQTDRKTGLLKNSPFYAGFAVDDLPKAKRFYTDTLGVFPVMEMGESLLSLHAGNGYAVLIYEKRSHTPAEHTILNFPVDDIDAAVDALAARGVEIERYDGMEQDEKGIMRAGGPFIAWFRDPAGNILSVLQER